MNPYPGADPYRDEMQRRAAFDAANAQPAPGAAPPALQTITPTVKPIETLARQQPIFQGDSDIAQLIARRNAPAPGAAPIADNSGIGTTLFPSTSAEIGKDIAAIGKATGPGAVLGTGIRSTANIARNVLSDSWQPAMKAAGAIGNQVSGFWNGVTGQAPRRPVNGGAAPTTPGSPSAPVAPVQPAGAPAPGTAVAAVAAPSRGVAGPRVADREVDRMNASAQQSGSGITATRQPNGTMSFSNLDAAGGAVAPVRQQAYTSGYDLAGSNERAIAAKDTENKITMQGAITSLLQRARETNDPRYEKELLSQAAQLQQGMTGNAGAIAQQGQAAAATSQTKAQTAALEQQTAATAANAKRVADVQTRYLASKDPAERKALGEQILTMLGKDPRSDKVQIAVHKMPDPNNPGMTVEVPFLIDLETKQVQRVDEAAAAGVIGGKPQAGPAGKFEEGKQYTDPTTGKTKTFKNGKFVD